MSVSDPCHPTPARVPGMHHYSRYFMWVLGEDPNVPYAYVAETSLRAISLAPFVCVSGCTVCMRALEARTRSLPLPQITDLCLAAWRQGFSLNWKDGFG